MNYCRSILSPANYNIFYLTRQRSNWSCINDVNTHTPAKLIVSLCVFARAFIHNFINYILRGCYTSPFREKASNKLILIKAYTMNTVCTILFIHSTWVCATFEENKNVNNARINVTKNIFYSQAYTHARFYYADTTL